MKNIYLVRHCRASGQAVDASLTEEGREQAVELAELLASRNIERIVSSPFLRAKQSVEPLVDRLRIEIEEDERLGERVLCDPPIDDWQEKLRKSYEDIDLRLKGGESTREAMNRGVAVIEEVLQSEAEHIVITSHGGLSTAVLKYFDDNFGYDSWAKMTNPDVYRLQFENGVLKEMQRVWLE